MLLIYGIYIIIFYSNNINIRYEVIIGKFFYDSFCFEIYEI